MWHLCRTGSLPMTTMSDRPTPDPPPTARRTTRSADVIASAPPGRLVFPPPLRRSTVAPPSRHTPGVPGGGARVEALHARVEALSHEVGALAGALANVAGAAQLAVAHGGAADRVPVDRLARAVGSLGETRAALAALLRETRGA